MARTAILYARVSTDEQAESGYSVTQQVDALRSHAGETGLTVLDEVVDAGYSGATLERPGIERIRDLVAEGGVDLILAQDQDRISREPWQYDFLRSLFEEYGTNLRALDDNGDGSPMGEFVSYIRRGVAKLERAEFAKRSRRNRLQKAREGKVIGNNRPNYGFRYNAGRDGYEVDKETMPVVRRIFEDVANGRSITSVVHTLNSPTGKPPPNGKKWSVTFVTDALQDDVYKPHRFEEVEGMVRPDVAARLDPDKSYGIWYYNRQRVKKIKRLVPDGNGGKRQKVRNQKTDMPRSEWIPVPVPDAGIPPEVVASARASVKGPRRPSKAADRFWELSGGIARCGECGRALRTHAIRKNGEPAYFYYGCPWPAHNQTCTNRKLVRAERLETRVADFVTDVLSDEGKLVSEIDALIENERLNLRDPEPEAVVWVESCPN